MSYIKELISENPGLYPTASTSSHQRINKHLEFDFALEVLSESCAINKGSVIETSQPNCKCPYLKYTKEHMKLNPVQFEDEYGSVLLLSREDIDNVKKKWRKIKNDPITFGMLLLITLLDDAPDTAKKLQAKPGVLFNGVMVYDNETMDSARRIAKLLNSIVKTLDQPEKATCLAHKRGVELSFHKEKYTKEDFEAIHSGIVKTIKKYYKMNNTPEIIDSIKKAIWIILSIIEDSMHWNDFGER